MLASIDKEQYSFRDFIATLHACTVAETMKDAIDAWLRAKNIMHDDDEFFSNAIDACVFYHLRRVALAAGNDEDAERFRQRMVSYWDSAVGEEEDEDLQGSVVDVNQIFTEIYPPLNHGA